MSLVSDISVIIVNYNTAALTVKAVESVLSRHHGGRVVDVHVVDNASPEGDGAVLEQAFSERNWTDRVTLYRESENHGFGRGNNLVLRQLVARADPPDYALLLNPDAQLDNEAIAILADFLDGHPEAVAAGARIKSPDGESVTAAFHFPNAINTFSSALSFGPVARLLKRWDVSLGETLPTSRVDWVAGAVVLFRLSAMKAADLFDPAYFLYYEEVDLMRRMTQQGGQIWYVAEAQAIHAEGASTKVKSGGLAHRRLPPYWYHSWQHYFLKNHGRIGALVAALAWITGTAGNVVVSSLRGRQPIAPPRFFRDFWSMVLRPLLGMKALPYD